MLGLSFQGPRWWRRRRIRQLLADSESFSDSEIELAIVHDRRASNGDVAEELMLERQERRREARRKGAMAAQGRN